MKARIKKTGEIVNIAKYATITLAQCDSWGNPVELKPEEVELIEEQTESEHWRDVRERAAIAAMQGAMTILGSCNRTAFRDVVISGYKGDKRTYPDIISQFAVACANALIEELKKR